MNILSSSGYRVMNMDSRQDAFNDASVLNSDYHLSKQSFFEKQSADVSDLDLVEKYLSNQR